MAGMVVAAGVDAARDLELQFAHVALPFGIGETGGDFLGDGDGTRVGKAAIIQAGAGDNIADQVEIGIG